jgi:hypothetical protein
VSRYIVERPDDTLYRNSSHFYLRIKQKIPPHYFEAGL